MQNIESVPFGFLSAEVKLYFLRSMEMESPRCSTRVLVDIRNFREKVLLPEGLDFANKDDYTGYPDHRELHGTNRTLLSWASLSALSYGIVTKDGAVPDSPIRLQVLFFAQKVMRSTLEQMIETEESALLNAQKRLVYWQPLVDRHRASLKAYVHVFGYRNELVEYLKKQVTAMWTRIKAALDDRNTTALKRSLKKPTAKILEIEEREGSPEED